MSTKFNERKLKLQGNTKSVLCAIALILLLSLSTFMAILPTANAHDPAWTVPTFAYLTVSPNPIGVNEQASVVFWLDKYPMSAAGDSGDRWQGLQIDVTAPDGTKSVLGPFVSDPIGSGYTLFTPTQTGTYTFVFSWPGQVLQAAGYTNKLGPYSDNVYVNDTFLGSTSETVSLTVQQDPVPQMQEYPLPTEYWQRPIEGQNTAWGSIASNWLSGSAITGVFQPYGIAPNSPHIVWTKPLAPGGVVGAGNPVNPAMTYYSGTQYEIKFANPIILNGYLYYNLPLSNSAKGGGTACVDLQTGQQLWYKNITIDFAQLYDYESPNQHGMIPGYLWSTGPYTAFGGNFGSGVLYPAAPNNGWLAYDPTTGDPLFNLTGVPSGTTVTGSDGSIDIYRFVTNSTGNYAMMWNNTAVLTELGYPNGTGAWQWRPLGDPDRTLDASNAYSWSVSVPWLPAGATIVSVMEGNMILGRNGTLPSIDRNGASSAPYTMWAMSLRQGSVGDMIWMKNYDAPVNNVSIALGPVSSEAGVFTVFLKETMNWLGYSIDDGSLLWGPSDSLGGWDFYVGNAGGSITPYSTAYGMLYTCGYDGVLYGYDLMTGNLEFTYGNGGEGNSTYSGFETVYGNYPLSLAAIADGKVYLITCEHSEDAPFYKGALLRCVDAFTGEEVWTIPYAGVTNAVAVADGYLVGLNLYDMQIYCFGRGQTATSISAPNTAVPLGTPVLIQGTVTDQSPGVTDTKKLSPNSLGTAAISDADQSAFMAYTYLQKPMPTSATGVPVELSITDPNGNMASIQTTSDLNGVYGVQYDPPVPGIYTVKASFDGTNSYFNSYIETKFLVSESAASPIVTSIPTQTNAPSGSISPSPSEAPQPTSAGTPTMTYIAVAAVVVIIAVLAAAVILRRRK
jgi:hypothetical protein